MSKEPRRCPWARSPEMAHYHDTEWGKPNHDDRHLFEMLTLEGAQAGLSWDTILRKRERYRKVFRDFDPAKVARITAAGVEKLMQDPGIVRNRAKIESTVSNAKAFLAIQREFGSLTLTCGASSAATRSTAGGAACRTFRPRRKSRRR